MAVVPQSPPSYTAEELRWRPSVAFAPGNPYLRGGPYPMCSRPVLELGVELLPRALQEAIDAFEASEPAKDVFGEDLHRAYVEFKRGEWEDFHNTVSEWEWNRYLTLY